MGLPLELDHVTRISESGAWRIRYKPEEFFARPVRQQQSHAMISPGDCPGGRDRHKQLTKQLDELRRLVGPGVADVEDVSVLHEKALR